MLFDEGCLSGAGHDFGILLNIDTTHDEGRKVEWCVNCGVTHVYNTYDNRVVNGESFVPDALKKERT